MGENYLLSTLGQLPAGHHCIQPLYGIPLGAVVLGELLHVLGRNFRVLVRRPANTGRLGADFLGDFAAAEKTLEILSVGYIVQIAIILPFLVHIRGLLVGLLLAPYWILDKDHPPVQQRVDHHHDNTHHDDNRDHALEQTLD